MPGGVWFSSHARLHVRGQGPGRELALSRGVFHWESRTKGDLGVSVRAAQTVTPYHDTVNEAHKFKCTKGRVVFMQG